MYYNLKVEVDGRYMLMYCNWKVQVDVRYLEGES